MVWKVAALATRTYSYNANSKVMPMTIQERIVSGVAIVSINGRVTLTDGTTEFDDTMQRLIQEGNVRVVLDFAQVPYIDSTALGTILRTHATVTRRGGALKLLRVKGHVRELLELNETADRVRGVRFGGRRDRERVGHAAARRVGCARHVSAGCFR